MYYTAMQSALSKRTYAVQSNGSTPLASARRTLPHAHIRSSNTVLQAPASYSNSLSCTSLRQPASLSHSHPFLSHQRCTLSPVKAASDAASGQLPSGPTGFEAFLGGVCQKLTNLFPLWVLIAAISGFFEPSLYTWFGSTHTTWGLTLVMLAMGLTLTLSDITTVFTKQPYLLALGMSLQYTILPLLGYLISHYWGLSTSLAVGVGLVSCMPGGTASNIVAYIAKGDMPLSVMMTTASTLAAIFTTPILTSLLVGTLVPVDARAMFLSVLQLVLAPVLIGACLNQAFPNAVKRIRPFSPFLATVVVFFIVGSMIGTNHAVVATSGLHIITATITLHGAGFFLGYMLSKLLGLSDKIARTNSIEVGMQSSALAAVLAKIHFPDPVVVAPCVLSACTHAFMGSMLAGWWRMRVKDEDEEQVVKA